MVDTKTDSAPALTMGDIYYVLFKHKWMIVGFTLIGLLAAAAAYRLWPDTIYRSEAKLFIRYIKESAAPSAAADDDAKIRQPEMRGDSIINSEVEILTSMDLAKRVATVVGPERVLDVYGGGSSVDSAGNAVRSGIAARSSRGSNVVTVVYAHPDQEVVQPVLSALIAEYLKKHVEIHMAADLYDGVLSKETLALRDRLAQTEEELRKIQDQAGVLSLDETKRATAEQSSKLRDQIWQTQLELSQHKAILEDYERAMSDKAVPSEKAQDYRGLISVLQVQNQRYQELLATFSADSAIMTSLRQRITENTATKEKMEAEYPMLLNLPPPTRIAAGQQQQQPLSRPEIGQIDPIEERARIRMLTTRLKVMQDDHERLRKESTDVSGLELSVSDLQRKRDLLEQQYRYLSSSLERARINETLGDGRVSNISIIQEPTPPERQDGKLYKVVGGLACGGLLFGLGLAFCLELFLDQTVRRAEEVESALGLPLFFSIPNVRGRLGNNHRSQPRLMGPKGPNGTNGTNGHGLPWPVHPQLASYFDALRDRLIFYFEIRGLTKKPKLVAVTSCGDRSGVSTVAAGLAASLSRTGEGNVLLVDMNMEQNAPYQFRNGTAQMGLDKLLESEDRTEARVHDKLYVVPHATGNERLARILPKRFTDMVPRLRASDYDYIIFDMPPVNQVSVTPQLARFMDMVFLMVESEKTNRGALKRASALLTQASCTLGVIVNRTRNYLPRALLQEV